jgi:hypothetical protein
LVTYRKLVTKGPPRQTVASGEVLEKKTMGLLTELRKFVTLEDTGVERSLDVAPRSRNGPDAPLLPRAQGGRVVTGDGDHPNGHDGSDGQK